MPTPILQSKLFIPPLRPQLVPRPHLIEQLRDGLNHKLILISAPAGFGKTTLVCDYLAQIDQPAVWLSLDEGDDDLTRFLTYFIAALQQIDPLVGQTAQSMLLAPQLPPSEELLTTLINELSTAPSVNSSKKIVLVLDDYHLIEAQAIHQALTFLLEHLPSQLCITITTRADPLLPLSRLRARGQLTEIRAADLRLSQAETGVFLNDLMHLNLAASDIALLDARTEGWMAGLQLAALSLEKLEDEAKQTFVATLSGEDRYILDYLLDEVLRQQPAPVQDFLLKTAVLDRLSAPLCDYLLEALHPHSQRALEKLERANLFLVSLDNTRGWYRYHHLFADLLYSQLQATDGTAIPKLHKRASQWYEENCYLSDAFAQAWQSQDFDYAVQLLKRHARDLLVRAELVTLVTWLAKLPHDLLAAQPQLCVYYAWAAATLLQLDQATSALKLVDAYIESASLSPDEMADWQGQTSVVRGLIASKNLDIGQFIALSQQGLAQLSPENHLLRGLAVANLAAAQWLAGDTVAACEAIEVAIGINQEADNITATLDLFGVLAQSTFEMGQLHRTEEICHRAIQFIEQYSALGRRRSIPSAGFIYVQLGQLYREWNRTDEAIAYLEKGIDVSKGESIGNLLMLRSLLSVIQGEQGEEERALAELMEIQQLSQRTATPQIMDHVVDIQMYLHLQQGEMEPVHKWIARTGIQASDTPAYFYEQRYLVFAKALIQQSRWADAEQLLGRLKTTTANGGRTGRVIQVLVYSALAQTGQGHHKRATTILQEALSIAESANYINTFRHAGPEIATLLAQIEPSTKEKQAYIHTLLGAFQVCSPTESTVRAPSTSTGPVSHSPLIEPLSDRELELLHLVADGRSNQEIANELFLAVGTVKKHLNNIFGKLAVASRTQAVARARELELLL